MENLAQHEEAQFQALDEMLGLIVFDEMYNAWRMPIVTALTDDRRGVWVIVSGARRKRDYRVCGIYFGPACADGFVGTLSLDGTKLISDESDHVFKVAFATEFRGWPIPAGKNLTWFFSHYGYGESYCEICFIEREADATIRLVKEGSSFYDALAAQPAPYWDCAALNLFFVLKGWYRATRHQAIMERHRSGFVASGKARVAEYTPISEELKVLNRDIGDVRRRIARERRAAA